LIYAKRFEARLSKIALAAKLGVTKLLIRQWESDQKMPTEVEWEKLSAVLNFEARPIEVTAQ
jgi:ribosome-binding protein aMBF1 (putative translation factor)